MRRLHLRHLAQRLIYRAAGDRRFTYFDEYMKNLALPRGAVQAMQDAKLQQMIRHVAAHVPFYRDFFRESGVDPARVVEAIRGGAARCWALEVRAPQILRRDLKAGFKAYMQYKDLNIVLDAGRAEQVSLPVTATVRELYTAMLAAGHGELDNSAIVTVLEDLAGVEVKGER